MEALIFDTETTGFVEPEVIEAAWISLSDMVEYCERFKPSKPISIGALATHHILDEELVGCSPSSSFSLPENVDYLIGHNIDYDWKVIGGPPIKRICTLALSRKLWQEADSHTQSAMMYLLFRSEAKSLLKNAHSALADVRMCWRILQIIIDKTGLSTYEELWEASEEARIPVIMPFGKHRGIKIADMPKDYKQWLLRQNDVDQYLRIALSGETNVI